MQTSAQGNRMRNTFATNGSSDAFAGDASVAYRFRQKVFPFPLIIGHSEYHTASAKESAICCWETGTGMKCAPASFAISRAALSSLYISSPKAMVKARIGRLKWHCAKPSTAQESIPPLK
jgi:hypothetical protein